MLGRLGINDLRNVGGFNDVQHAGTRRAFKGDRTDLRHAVVIEHACAGPELFEPRTHRCSAAAGFACHDEESDLRGREIDVFASGHLGQMHGVGRCATENGGLMLEDGAQARDTAHPAPC